MIIVVTGSREWTDKERIRERLLELKPDIVVQGGAPGVDRLTKRVCEEEGIRCETEKANWKRFHGGAGHIRNGEMLRKWSPDLVVAFWNGFSPGTKGCLDEAERMNLSFEINGPGKVSYYSTEGL